MKALLYLFIGIVTIVACVPAPSSDNKNCASGKTYSPSLKTCVANNLLGLGLTPVAGANQIISAVEATPQAFSVNTASDADSPNLYYLVTVSPNYGTLTNCMNLSGSTGFNDLTCTYTPSGNFIGQDSFSYYVNDGVFSSQVATVTFNVANGDDDPPVFAYVVSTVNSYEDGISTPSLVTYGIPVTLSTAIDPDNEAVTYTLDSVTTGTFGLTCANNNSVTSCTYTPVTNVFGSQTVTYTAHGASGASTTTTFTINLASVNDLPIIISAPSCASTATQAQAFSCSVLATVYDVETASVSLTLNKLGSSSCSWASLASGSGLITGTPVNSNVANATCTLNYTVSDGLATSSATSVTITQLDAQPQLSFTTTTATLSETDTSSIVFLGSVISITDGVESESVGSYSVAAPSTGTSCYNFGSFSITSTGAVTFTKTDFDYNGSCYFNVSFDDGNSSAFPALSSTTATTMLTITGVNDAPTISFSTNSAVTNYGSGFSGISVTIDEGGGLWEDSQTASITITASPASLLPLAGIVTSTSGSTTATYTATVSGITYDNSSISASTVPIFLTITPAGGHSGTGTVTITVSDGLTTTTASLQLTVNDIYAIHGGWDEIQAFGAKVDASGVNLESGGWESKVRIKWRQASVYAGAAPATSPSYYQVLRYGPNIAGSNTTTIASNVSTSLLEATDTTALSGQVYWYKAVPMDSTGLPIKIVGLTEVETVTISTPPQNMVLVHPWVVNRERCLKLGVTASALDYINDQSCALGFQQTKSFWVDRYEAGCHFNLYPDCSEIGVNGCIDTSAPVDGAMALSTSYGFFYNRSNGICYVTNNSGTNWYALSTGTNTAVPFANIAANTAQLPPLVNLKQSIASSYCKTATLTLNCGTSTCTTTLTATVAELPSRIDQVIYSAWSTGTTDISKASLEAGGNLSSSSYCNSTKSNGLLYFDMNMPGPSYLDGLPFTYTAANGTTNYRSVRSGSDATASCVSAYGAQDTIGNVREWTSSNFYCSAGTCTPTAVAAVQGSSSSSTSFASYGFKFDGSYGPGGDTALTWWDTNYPSIPVTSTGTSLTTFQTILGFPLVTTSTTVNTVTVAVSTIVTSLNNDTGFFSDMTVTGTRALVTGGTWQDSNIIGAASTGAEAGRWSADLIPSASTATDIGFRCLIRLPY